MHENTHSIEDEQWIIWNSALGLRDFVEIGRIEADEAWLEEPYEMVGPFSVDELATEGCISFAACVVMSRQRWQQDQVQLRQASYEKRQKAQERLFEELHRSNRRKRAHGSPLQQCSEKEQRALLDLPLEGTLESLQIKAAYRRLAKAAHPDTGGSHEQFVQLTEARDALLELVL